MEYNGNREKSLLDRATEAASIFVGATVCSYLAFKTGESVLDGDPTMAVIYACATRFSVTGAIDHYRRQSGEILE